MNTSRQSALGLFPDGPTPRLYNGVVEVLRTRHYSRRTEEAYGWWRRARRGRQDCPPYRRIRRVILFHKRSHPRELGESDVNRFLTQLAVEENVAAPTQNRALAALLFLYEHVLSRPLNRIEGVARARRARRLPVVLTRDEVAAALEHLGGVSRLVCTLLYGPGVRLLEGLGLRVKGLDFGGGQILVRDGKGQRDRVTMLPGVLDQPLEDHLEGVRELHEADLKAGLGQAPLPDALLSKMLESTRPSDREWGWQWVFPASSHYVDPRTGMRHRHHLHEPVIQKAVHEAARRAGITKTATPHRFGHSFATHLLEDGSPTSGPCRSCWGSGT